MKQYFSPWSVWKVDMVVQAHTVEYIQTRTEEEALLLEEQLIKNYLPEYNRLLKNNSNYLWVKYTDEDFPQIQIVRKRKNDKAIYIWPKQRSRKFYTMMKYLRRIFKYRTMPRTAFSKGVLDMDFHLKLDEWRSVIHKLNKEHTQYDRRKQLATKNWIDTDISYDTRKDTYKQRLITLKKFLEWDTQNLLDTLANQIEYFASKENFERCAELKNIYEYIKEWDIQYQSVVLDTLRDGKIGWITQIQDQYVVIIIQFTKWKIIDVIRHKKDLIWLDIEQIIIELKTEFWFRNTYSKGTVTRISTRWYSMLKSSDKKELEDLYLKFLESYVSSHAFDKGSIMWEILVWLMKRYSFPKLPYHIECIDISHLSWGWISGWLSCYINGLPSKGWYRQYKIKSVEKWKSDDYASLKEIIIRRFWLEKKEIQVDDIPELFVIDGWKGQLWILESIQDEYPRFEKVLQYTHFVSLGKWKARTKKWRMSWAVEEVFWFDNWNIQSIKLVYDEIDRILLSCRDEAHRFSNRYRKKQMSQEIKIEKNPRKKS